jgi:aminopeptidase N
MSTQCNALCSSEVIKYSKMMQNVHCRFVNFFYSISANLKNVVYCTAIRVGGQEEWDFAWQRYRKTNVGSEKDILLGALGCSREIWILSRYCSLYLLRFITVIKNFYILRIQKVIPVSILGSVIQYM